MQRLQFQTPMKDVRSGLLSSLTGIPMGAVFALLYETLPNRHGWLFAFVIVMTLFYTYATEFVSEFTSSALMGLMLGIGATITVKNALVAPSALGLQLAGTYYIAFAIMTLMRWRHGTLPI